MCAISAVFLVFGRSGREPIARGVLLASEGEKLFLAGHRHGFSRSQLAAVHCRAGYEFVDWGWIRGFDDEKKPFGDDPH